MQCVLSIQLPITRAIRQHQLRWLRSLLPVAWWLGQYALSASVLNSIKPVPQLVCRVTSVQKFAAQTAASKKPPSCMLTTAQQCNWQLTKPLRSLLECRAVERKSWYVYLYVLIMWLNKLLICTVLKHPDAGPLGLHTAGATAESGVTTFRRKALSGSCSKLYEHASMHLSTAQRPTVPATGWHCHPCRQQKQRVGHSSCIPRSFHQNWQPV